MHSPAAAIGCFAPLCSHRFTLVGALLAVALLHIHAALDGASFWSVLVTPDHTDIRDVLVRESLPPRIAMTVLWGAALGLAGVLAQQVLRNPLAELMTLGIFPGAYLALMIATIWMPAWLSVGREVIALAMLAVFALAWRQRMSPLAVILSGMVVNLYCGAIILAITMVHFDLLTGYNDLGRRLARPDRLAGEPASAAALRPLRRRDMAAEQSACRIRYRRQQRPQSRYPGSAYPLRRAADRRFTDCVRCVDGRCDRFHRACRSHVSEALRCSPLRA